MPECRCRPEKVDSRKKFRCRTNFSTVFRHLHMIFQHHTALITPATAVYRRAVYEYITFHCIQFAVWTCRVNFFILSMPECRTVRHLISPVPEWTKTPMPEPVRYRDKRTQSGTRMLRYRTKTQGAGMPMPAALALMPMPSYALKCIERVRLPTSCPCSARGGFVQYRPAGKLCHNVPSYWQHQGEMVSTV
jgi:hypothetical protein